jgi:hypothetical protein
MAEVQKNVEAPLETKTETIAPAPLAETAPVVDTKPAEVAPVETAPVTTDAVEETKPAEATEEAPKVEDKKEEVKPVEEGHLSHKATGLSFPKNLIPSKEFFFFGNDAVESKSLSHYLRTEKSAETAHHNIAWASHTGKGLLFIGDKKTPSSVINLADATEPETDGSNKFHFTAKGNKHSFKAASTAERDNWVAQLKLKIAEAKELAPTVTESENYKTTTESYKPAPVAKKEEKVAEAPKEEATTTDEVAPVPVHDVVTEAPKEEEVKAEEPKKDELKTEEPKRRSASRKRASFFGFGKRDSSAHKEEHKKEEVKPAEETAVTDAPATETPAVTEAPVVPIETAAVTAPAVAPIAPVENLTTETAPVTEAPKTEEAPVTEAAPAVEETAVEDKAVAPKEKPVPTKRNSIFGVFSRKEKKSPEIKPTEPVEAPKDNLESAETAPVIPPVETTTPLAVDVSNPTNVPVENTEVVSPTVVEPKKDVKEKRKSSLPFAFGKRDKSPAPVEGESSEGEVKKERGKSPFSKLRATINRKTSSSKPESDKAAEETKVEEPVTKDETVKDEIKTEEAPAVVPAKAEPEAETKPESVPTTTPAVTAAA